MAVKLGDMNATRMERRLSDHRDSVREFVDAATQVPRDRWHAPRAEGKWTPAQETRHITMTYEQFLRELSGGTPMRLKGSSWQRRIWRMWALTFILWRKRIPVAVRAPREVRPVEQEGGDATELLPLLRRTTEEFDRAWTAAIRDRPTTRLTHPFFGALTLDQSIQLMTVHTRHHAAFVRAALSKGITTGTRT